MEHICIKCGNGMKKAKLHIYGHVTIRDASKESYYGGDSKIVSYCCPTCGYIENYAEKPEVFK